jgi:hypothetical protein
VIWLISSLEPRWRYCNSLSLNKQWQFGDQNLLNIRFAIWLCFIARSSLVILQQPIAKQAMAIWQTPIVKQAKVIWVKFYRLIYAGDLAKNNR